MFYNIKLMMCGFLYHRMCTFVPLTIYGSGK
jgi:hypothetical protein